MARAATLLQTAALAALVASLASGCQLIADFDRSKIPDDAGQLPEGGAFDGGADAQLPDGSLDAGPDAELPFDAGSDAGHDAGDDDAGGDDAGDDDAG